jgi:hypothetical protein
MLKQVQHDGGDFDTPRFARHSITGVNNGG